MDTSYLAQQVNSSIRQLHGLFDEIGVPNHEREQREAELFDALSEALNSQVRLVNTKKEEMIDKANTIINQIRQMEASLDDSKHRRGGGDSDQFQITYPLNRCLEGLQDKHMQIKRLRKERLEQVMKLVEALQSYSSHLEPTFVQIPLPSTDPRESIPLNFDLSSSYVDRLDAEFTRVYEEYTRRIATVQTLANNTIQLWAELGTAQEEQDSAIVKYYREQPEQLGLHERDIAILRQKRDSLSDQKKNREKKLQNLRANVEALWIKLDVDPAETKPFLNQNRGCGLRQISQFEAELARLNELKHQNLHLFVEDSRVKLQELWDSLYFSEDEMLEFTPAFSDVYSDALLEAHEREVARLEALKDQRGPTLALIDRHKSLIKERDDLATSSQDASRLMMRGQKGEKRDPGKLLREEKMRKRIAKELPKVTVEVRKILENWEEEYGRPFLVYGERYLDELEADDVKKTNLPPRSKTPAGLPPPSTTKVPTKTGPPSRANSTRSIPPRSMTKTPTAGMNGNAGKKTPGRNGNTMTSGKGSPSRIPARAPLSNLKHGSNSPERPRPESRGNGLRHGAPLRAPPPKMRELVPVDLETPANPYKSMGLPGSIVRRVEPEDVYDDRPQTRSNSGQSQYTQPSSYCDSDYDDRYATIRGAPTAYHSQQQQQQQHQQSNHHKYPMAPPPPRHVSGTSTQGSTNISGSENWETYDDNSEPEPDASEAYYAKLRAARGKRMEPESGHENVMRLGGGGSGPGGSAPGAGNSQSKRVKGIPPMMNGYGGPSVMVDQESGRIVSGSEWTDEDAY